MEPANKLLTIGMAVYDDYNGVYFTIKALQLYHSHILDQVSILIVDNNPFSLQGIATAKFVEKLKNLDISYYPYTERHGTSAPRDQVIKQAQTPWVLVCDPHIFFEQGSLDYLLNFLKTEAKPEMLLSAALMSEDGKIGYVFYQPKWRGGLYGIWGPTFSREELDHLEPMEIVGAGLGVFVCHKDFWPGFHPLHKGFGGEELYIHEKYRRKGGVCIALPKLRYHHRFGYAFRGSTPYPDKYYYRARNYVLEFKELGWDIKEIGIYYVGHGYITLEDWKYLLQNPEKHDEPPSDVIIEKDKWNPERLQENHAVSVPQQPAPEANKTRQKLQAEMDAASKLAEEIQKSSNFEELFNRFSIRKEKIDFSIPIKGKVLVFANTIFDLPFLLFSQAEQGTKFIIFHKEPRNLPVLDALHSVLKERYDLRYSIAVPIEIFTPTNEVDTLAIDPSGFGNELLNALESFLPYATNVIVYNSSSNPDLYQDIVKLIFEKFKAYSPVVDQNPLFVSFSRKAEEREIPNIFQRAKTYLQSLKKRAIKQSTRVSDEEVDRRLSICSTCEFRRGNVCTICGCYLVGGILGDGKVYWSDEHCPIDKW